MKKLKREHVEFIGIEGWIRLAGDHNGHESVYICGAKPMPFAVEPLAVVLKYKLAYKFVDVRYWICDKVMTKDEANESFIRQLLGDSEVAYHAHFSDYTGYLYTDDYLQVGGHDLIKELTSYTDKYLIMEINVYIDNS